MAQKTVPEPPVSAVRAVSRQLIRELGFLADGRDGFGLSHTQCHALIELESRGGLGLGGLAQVLCLDESSVSRTISGLESRGLVARARDPEDGRRRPIVLTEEGRTTLARVHARLDAQVRDALDGLGAEDCQRALEGMSIYVRALATQRRRREFVFRPIEPEDDAAVAAIIRTVMTSFGACGAGYAIEDPEVDAMTAAFAGPRRVCLVVEREGEVLGAGGIAPLVGSDDPDLCELQKMYFLPEARGCGLGRRLLERLLDEARSLGYTRCYLETLERMQAARRLYESLGFVPLEEAMGDTGHFSCDRQYLRPL